MHFVARHEELHKCLSKSKVVHEQSSKLGLEKEQRHFVGTLHGIISSGCWFHVLFSHIFGGIFPTDSDCSGGLVYHQSVNRRFTIDSPLIHHRLTID